MLAEEGQYGEIKGDVGSLHYRNRIEDIDRKLHFQTNNAGHLTSGRHEVIVIAHKIHVCEDCSFPTDTPT